MQDNDGVGALVVSVRVVGWQGRLFGKRSGCVSREG